MARTARRFKLNQDTGITISVAGRADIRIDPGSHYTTEDKDEIETLKASPFVSEVKIPASDKK